MLIKSLKWYKRLNARKGRIEAGAFLVEGYKAILQIINTHPGEIIEILSTKELSPLYHNFSIRIISEDQIRSICNTKSPQGIIAVIRSPIDIYSSHLPVNVNGNILLLDDIQDPGNVGTLIRTAAAFNFVGVILTEKCADPLSPKCVQSTTGAILSLWIRRTNRYLELAEELKGSGYSLAAADVDGREAPSLLCRMDRLLLALGSEASGLSKSIIDASNYKIRIPINREKAESLNVAACGAICMHMAFQNSLS
ncbi:MAG: RNA methyltransferase [Spirochaetota bacterium]|nr:RNA methyltransferase [Spirochaetota bacterium]